jgi:hypothetical protein
VRRAAGRPTLHPRLIVFALLGMSNWVHRWYDPRGVWDAEQIAEGFIMLLERGYRGAREPTRSDVDRRLRAVQAELREVRQLFRAGR